MRIVGWSVMTPSINSTATPASTLKYVEEVLAAFLADPQPGVLALKGEWGVGKTYLWNRYIAEQKKAAGCDSYAYASVFGVASTIELRRALFTSLRPLDPTAKPKVPFWKRWSGNAARHVDFGFSAGLSVELKNTELWADAVENQALRGMVVCIDDLERKEETLSASALLGFVTSLRDERSCKVVLLFNEMKAAANKEFAPVLAEFREKVIDREILLNPTVAECFSLIFNDRRFEEVAAKPSPSTPFQPADQRTLLEIFEAVKVSNIRVLRKTRQAIEYFETHMAAKYRRLWPMFMRQVVKLCYLHYCHEKDFPVRDVADHKRWINVYAKTNKENRDEELKKYTPVKMVGYQMRSADELIVGFLEKGFVSWTEADALLAALETEQANLELGVQYRATWDRYWNNFQGSQAEVLDGQRSFLQAHHDQMSVAEISQVLDFLETFGPAPAEEKILIAAVEAYVIANPDPSPFDSDPRGASKKAAQMLRDRQALVVHKKPISEAVVMMTGPDSWNDRDLRFLTTYTEGDFLEWLKTSTDTRLLHRLKTFRERFGENQQGKPIVARLDVALRQLEKRSELDARRVRDGVGMLEEKQQSGTAPSDGRA